MRDTYSWVCLKLLLTFAVLQVSPVEHWTVKATTRMWSTTQASIACSIFIFASATTALPFSRRQESVEQPHHYIISATSGPEGSACNNDIIDSMILPDKSTSYGCVSLDSPAYCIAWNSSLAIEEVLVFENYGCRPGGNPLIRKAEADGMFVMQSSTPIFSFLVDHQKNVLG